MKSHTKYDLDIDFWPWPWKVLSRSKFLKNINQEKLSKVKVKVNQNVKVKVEQKVKFTWLAVTSHQIVTETSNLVHILVYEKVHQMWPWPWILTLKSLPRVKIFWKIWIKENSQRWRWKSTKMSNSLKLTLTLKNLSKIKSCGIGDYSWRKFALYECGASSISVWLDKIRWFLYI